MDIAISVFFGVIVLAVLFALGIYNNLQLNQFKNAFSQIDVQLKRRYDLIPNLVKTAKAYMKHEREALEAVIAARNQASATVRQAAADPGNAQAMTALAGAENTLSGALGRLFALVESYPDLKANHNMMQLSEEITSTENRVAFARQTYNDAVTTYNTSREVFPSSLIAGSFGFMPASALDIENAERQAPHVSFS